MDFAVIRRAFSISSLIFLWCFAALPANAEENGDDSPVNYLSNLTRLTLLSCETLIVLDYKNTQKQWSFENMGTPVEVNADLSDCRLKLQSMMLDKAFAPVFQYLEAASRASGNDNSEDTKAEMQMRKTQQNRQNQKLKEGMVERLQPIVDMCRNLTPKAANGDKRVCYFGAFGQNAANPARAAFRAMAENRLIDGEAVCARDPLRRNQATEPELQNFIGASEDRLSWKEARASLGQDGFLCNSDKDNDRCSKMVLGIWLDLPMAVEMKGATFGKDYIMPRLLSVYNGDWFITGPGNYREDCIQDKTSKKFVCTEKKPKRGTKQGICMVGEDWHTFYGLPIIMNGIHE
jgi:hypothetical protein